MPGADVQCRASEAPPGRPNLSGSADELLLQAARHADEQQRSRNQPRVKEGGQRSGLQRSIPEPMAPPPRASGAPRTPPGPGPGAERALPRAAVRTQGPRREIEVLQHVAVGDQEPAQRLSSLADERRSEARASSIRSVVMRQAVGGTLARESVPADTRQATTADILAFAPSLHAATRAAADGSVLELAGDMDAETTCAVVAFAAREVDEVAAELGLGELSAWHITIGESAWYVVNDDGELVVAVGESSKNPGSVLQKITNGCRP